MCHSTSRCDILFLTSYRAISRCRKKVTAMDVRNAVLELPELLELILSCLDWRTLLLSQAVNRQWRSVIRERENLQRLLGLSTACEREYWAVQKNSLDVFIGARRVSEAGLNTINADETILEKAVPTGPMRLLASGGLGNPLSDNFGTEYMFRWQSIPRKLLEETSQDASFRQMQCTQPPVLSVYGCTTVFYRDTLMFRRVPGHRPLLRIANDSGVTLGQIIDVVKQWKAEAPENVDWYNELFTFTAVGYVAQDEFFTRLERWVR